MDNFDIKDPSLESIEIKIQPDTLEYYMDIHMVQLSHLYNVLLDIVKRIESGEISDKSDQPGLNVYPIEDNEDPLS